MNRTKVALVIGQLWGGILVLIGFTGLFFFTLMVMVGFSSASTLGEDYQTMQTIFIVIDIIFLLLFVMGVKKLMLVGSFKKYVSVLSRDPSGSIENLAAATKTSQEKVKKQLDAMIRSNYFVNAHIDHRSNRVVIGNLTQEPVRVVVRPVQQQGVQPQQGVQQAPAYVTVTCKSCGGVNKILKGNVGECDYCGSPVQG